MPVYSLSFADFFAKLFALIKLLLSLFNSFNPKATVSAE